MLFYLNIKLALNGKVNFTNPISKLDGRQRAMLDFAWKLTTAPHLVDDGDRDGLRGHGLSDEDVFDLSETTAFFNLSNRMASASDMMPNAEYHRADRGPAFVPPVAKPKAAR